MLDKVDYNFKEEDIESLWDHIDFDLKQFNNSKTTIDYLNDSLDDGAYYIDLMREWANNQVDIYYHDLYKTASEYAYYTDEAIEQNLIDLSSSPQLCQILQVGQEHFYFSFGNEVLTALTELKK